MRNSVSERSLIIESDDDEEEQQQHRRGGDVEDHAGSDSDGSGSSSSSCATPRRGPATASASSYTHQWPQSYRLSNSFLNNSFRGKTPEIISNLVKPLLRPTTSDELQEQQQEQQHEDIRKSSQYVLPSSRKPSLDQIPEDRKPVVVGHEASPYQKCSYTQGVTNGINVLCGVGILSTPYAIKQGGWLGMVILCLFALLAWYTGVLLRRCLDSKEGLETYPDIGHAAFGTTGRIAISVKSRSAGGVIASFLVVMCLFWIGIIDNVGFENKGTVLNLPGIPIAIGLYGYCYSGHGVFPNIYSSLKNRLVMALVGSLLTMLVTYILPCACFLAILKKKVTWYQIAACSFIIVVGVCCACVGTYSSLSSIIQSYS
ncbi:hypothetical protein PR202_gb12533 [Eleusine coracana subsp. coracana]|uniref:Amino acid transporter transmembrane domain-containing protein n=1 Tax=Eleusine coracana subsp. coracana TaxID=191504 RepID=A0AAV5EQA2_ELECO|nr:hypothetical protein PR202_gb12533 [Eleusine coracana subsp. coracana]